MSDPLPTETAQPSRVYAKYIESTVKGGVRFTLGPKVLIVGANASGKDAVLNSLQFAATAAVDDLNERDAVKDPFLLGTLGPPAGNMKARITWSDNTYSTHTLPRREGGGWSKAVATNAKPDVLLLRAFREAVQGSSDTLRKYLIARVYGKLTLAEILRRLAPDLGNDAEGNAQEHPLRAQYTLAAAPYSKLSPVDALVAVIAQQKALAVVRSGQEQVEPTFVEPTGDQITAANKACLDAERENVALQARASLARAVTQHEATTQAAVMAFQTAKAAMLAAEARVTPDATAANSKIVHLDHFLAGHAIQHARIDAGKLGCLYCASNQPMTHEAINAVNDALKAQRVTLQQQAQSVSDAAQAKRWAEGRQAEAFAAADRLEQARASAGEPVDPAALTAAAERATAARAAYANLISQQGAWSSYRSQRAAAQRAVAAAEQADKLYDACRDCLAELLASAIADFEQRVQGFLSPDLKDREGNPNVFRLILNEGERETCRFGFERVGINEHGLRVTSVQTALSGFESTLLYVAMVTAMAPDNTEPAIVIPPERAYDPVSLEALMRAVTHAPVQIILAHPTLPAHIPPGWTLITVGAVASPVVESDGDVDTQHDVTTSAAAAPKKRGRPRKRHACPAVEGAECAAGEPCAKGTCAQQLVNMVRDAENAPVLGTPEAALPLNFVL